MGRSILLITWILLSLFGFSVPRATAVLRLNHYANVCPNVESLVRKAVETKFRKTFVTIPATLRLFFHDCFVQGCDASIMISSTTNHKAEKDHPDNLSLAGDGFDTVVKAKAAVDAVTRCKNKVSCADILAMAARDVISLAGGPKYPVELGRMDGLTSTAESVEGKLPQPFFGLDQLNSLFAPHGLTQTDIIALSGAHSLGFSHCSRFANRIYSFSHKTALDPTLNSSYAAELRLMCPEKVDPTVAIDMDPVTPRIFDNFYYKNLQEGKGLFTSDQTFYADRRTRPFVDSWAGNSTAFFQAFVSAVTKMGRIRAAGRDGNIRRDCSAFN